MSNLKEEMVKLKQQNVEINEDKVNKQCRKMPNWKVPGHDGEISSWMTYIRSVLCQKDPLKGKPSENSRPITCLLLVWKLLTGII